MDVVRATGSFVRDLNIYLTVELHHLQVGFFLSLIGCWRTFASKEQGLHSDKSTTLRWRGKEGFSFQEDVVYICKAVVC